MLRAWIPEQRWSVYVSNDRIDNTCAVRARREVLYLITVKQRLPHYQTKLDPPIHFIRLAFFNQSWTQSLPSQTRLPSLLVIVPIENGFQFLDCPPIQRLPSQHIFALKSPLTTDHPIIQRVRTKPTPTRAIPLPRTSSFHSPHPGLVGSTPTGDAARFHPP